MRSSAQLFGIPLIHIATGRSQSGVYQRGIARGWIAIGDVAFGFLAVGGVSFGVLSLGGFAFGGLAIGGAAAGMLAMGGFALGYDALGGLAIASEAAAGGLAIAAQYAVGGQAIAPHANDAVAQEYFLRNPLQIGTWMIRQSRWFLLLAPLPALILLMRRITSSNEERTP